jgi:DNA modification methylase
VIQVLQGDCRTVLPLLESESVQCCVTSPPYWGLRDYGHADQIGQEPTPDAYVQTMVRVFAEVRRVLKEDGTCWLNLGDSYASAWSVAGGNGRPVGAGSLENGNRAARPNRLVGGLKEKDLIGIPWRVALALQADGWYLRSDIIWAKKNCMPESVTDRPTRSHEYIFLLTKSPRYFYDADAIKEPCIYPEDLRRPYAPGQVDERGDGHARREKQPIRKTDKQRGHSRRHDGFNERWDHMDREEQCTGMRNKRDVWTVAPAQYPEAHFATYPPELIKPCILAGTKAGDMVLDPFGGSGTTGEVALELGRRATLIELNPEYVPLIHRRTNVTPGLALA